VPNHVIGVTHNESGGKTPGFLNFSIRTEVSGQLNVQGTFLQRNC
jgi:hypothetical protein